MVTTYVFKKEDTVKLEFEIYDYDQTTLIDPDTVVFRIRRGSSVILEETPSKKEVGKYETYVSIGETGFYIGELEITYLSYKSVSRFYIKVVEVE